MTQKQEALWRALEQVRTLEFVAQSRGSIGWTGRGSGTVIIERPQPDILLFHETGVWRPAHKSMRGGKDPAAGREVEFRNTYRWAMSESGARLEHLRFGESHPVYLFDLAPESETRWVSVAPHLCRQDEYTACLQVEDDALSLNWTIVGPEKNEAILYRYSF